MSDQLKPENTAQQEASAVPKTTSLPGRLKTDTSLRNKVIAAAAAVILVIVVIIAVSSSKKTDDSYHYVANNTTLSSQPSNNQNQSSGNSGNSSSGSQSNGNSSNSSSGSQPNGNSSTSTSTQASSSDTAPKISTYSVTTSQGEKLEVQPGYSYVAMTHVLVNTSGRSASILIPTVFDYAQDTYTMGDESCYNGVYSLIFKTDGNSGLDFVANYVAALSNYGFSLEKTFTASDNQVVYYLNYSGSITHGSASFLGTPYDISVTAYKDFLTSNVIFAYPEEVGFDLSGSDSDPEYSSAKVSTTYFFNGKDNFKISGWGASGDYITLYFDPGTYGTGDILRTEDFQSQSGAGQSALCHVSIGGDILGNGVWPIYINDLDTIEVKILESSDSCLAISYYIEVTKGSNRYTLEGVCAAEPEGGSYAGEYETPNTNNNSAGTGIGGSGKCSFCNGTGTESCKTCGGGGVVTCHKCGGNGLEICQACKGAGTVRNSYTGELSACSGCQGGYIKCKSCNGGRKKCDTCHGTGKTTCSYCHGIGN